MKGIKALKKKMAAANQGFTLLEILVVLTIMGFLIAMVAPRLAGISSSAVDTVCDTNQNRMISMMAGYFEKTNKFPTKLTNLVEETADEAVGGTTYQIPGVSDDLADNGPEVLASEFMSRNHFRIHYLNEAELSELRGLGITQVFNLNSYDAYNGLAVKANYDNTAGVVNDVALTTPITDRQPKMRLVTLPEDLTADPSLAVAMIGIGDSNGAAAAETWVLHTGERGWGEPNWFGRIVMGFGPENGLITSGIVANAAHCPGGIQNADNVTYNDYNIVLPRLAATVARWDTDDDGDIDDADEAALGFDAAVDLTALAAVAYDEEPPAAYNMATNDDDLKYRTYDITEAQEPWQYATQCPEGHMYPADDEEFWGIDIDGDATLD